MSKVSENLVSIVGPNTLGVDTCLNNIKQDFISQNGDLAVEVIDGEEVSLDQIKASLESLPFLSSNKLVVIKRLSNNKPASEKIEELLGLVSDGTKLLIVEPKPDRRSTYFKTLKKMTNLQEFAELDAYSLAKWLIEQAKNGGGKLSPTDANYLIERVGANQQLLHSELQKLLDYDDNISRKSIEDLTEPSPQGTIFNLLDTAFSGNKKIALDLYESQRAQKVEPQAILGMIVWQVHLVAMVSATQKTVDQIASETKKSPFVIKKARHISDKMSKSDIRQMLSRLSNLDKNLKSQNIDADEAVKQFLFSV